MRTMRLAAAVCGLVWSVCGQTARADLIPVRMGGTITSADDPGNVLSGQVQVGDPWEMVFMMDMDAVDEYPNLLEYGKYRSAFQELSLNINNIIVRDVGINTFLSVDLDVLAHDLLFFTNSSVNTPFDVLELGVYLRDRDKTVLEDDNIPYSIPDINEFENADLDFIGEDSTGNRFYIEGVVEYLLPEPSACIMLLISLPLVVRRK